MPRVRNWLSPPPPPIGSQTKPAEDLLPSTSWRTEKLEKKEVSLEPRHDVQRNANKTTTAIEIVRFMEGRSNITVELTRRRESKHPFAAPGKLRQALPPLASNEFVGHDRSRSVTGASFVFHRKLLFHGYHQYAPHLVILHCFSIDLTLSRCKKNNNFAPFELSKIIDKVGRGWIRNAHLCGSAFGKKARRKTRSHISVYLDGAILVIGKIDYARVAGVATPLIREIWNRRDECLSVLSAAMRQSQSPLLIIESCDFARPGVAGVAHRIPI